MPRTHLIAIAIALLAAAAPALADTGAVHSRKDVGPGISGRGDDFAVHSRKDVGPAIGGRGDDFAIHSRKAVGPGLSGRGDGFAVASRKVVGPVARTRAREKAFATSAKALDLNSRL